MEASKHGTCYGALPLIVAFASMIHTSWPGRVVTGLGSPLA